MDSDDEIDMQDSGSEGQDEFEDEFLTTADLEEEMKDSISYVKDILEVPSGTCRILLHKYKWNHTTLLEKFYEHPDTNAFLVAAQVIPKKIGSDDLEAVSSTGECDICCDISELSGLACNHRACATCWGAYLTERISEGGSEIQCMSTDCELLVEDEKVYAYVEDPMVRSAYERLVLNSFVETNPILTWCPGPGCGRAVKINNTDPHSISCPCGASFCFFCGIECHEPVNCRLLKLWQKRCLSDAETFNWISANTKDCPKCFTPIEKNGGCNRILCRSSKCRFQFCWQCMRDWDVHGYSPCNTFEDKAAKDSREKSRISLDRYLFYYNRYHNHKKSLELEEKLNVTIRKKMEQMQELRMSWVEVQYLAKAVKVLSECRKTMLHTYVFAFYLERDNNSQIFENNQKDLEMAVEQLSGFLEGDIHDEDNLVMLKQKVLDKCSYLEHRRKILLDHCREGTEQDIWVFKENSFPEK